MIVDRTPLAVPPAQDERLVGRPRVHEVAPIAFGAERHERPDVLERDREAAERAFQFVQRNALLPRVELLEELVERRRHGISGNRSIAWALR